MFASAADNPVPSRAQGGCRGSTDRVPGQAQLRIGRQLARDRLSIVLEMPVRIREQALDLLRSDPSFSSHRLVAQFSKDILVSDQKELVLAEHRLQEVAAQLASELIRRINRKVDLAVQRFLRVCDSVDNIRELRPTHDHQIDIALLALTGTRHGAIDKSKVDLRSERAERGQENVADSDRLRDNGPHLGEDGAGRVGAKEGLGSQSLFGHQTGVDQLAQLPLHGPQCNPRHPGKLS